jgi:hypothetical protein
MTNNDFAILEEMDLTWAVKFRVGSNNTPRNFAV